MAWLLQAVCTHPLLACCLQALCIAACYPEDWPLLIICPATMKLVWQEAGEQFRECGSAMLCSSGVVLFAQRDSGVAVRSQAAVAGLQAGLLWHSTWLVA